MLTVHKFVGDWGLPDLSHADIMATGQRHWTAVSEVLGDQPFFLGERPSALDATVYAFLISLVAYAERIKSAYWA